MKTTLRFIALGFFLLVAALVVFLTLWPRPTDTTEPWVVSGDGALVDYCSPATLDGQGLSADEIPKTYTPKLWLFSHAYAHLAQLSGTNRNRYSR